MTVLSKQRRAQERRLLLDSNAKRRIARAMVAAESKDASIETMIESVDDRLKELERREPSR